MKHIEIIINPASGTDTPILGVMNTALQKSGFSWDIKITQKKGDVMAMTRAAIKKGVSRIAVSGGDSTVNEAAQALAHSSIPLCILPGGTANIMAKELQIPLAVDQAVALMVNKKAKKKAIDMGICNNVPFMVRASIGVFADMVLHADTDLKQTVGQLAYPITAIKKMIDKDVVSTYQMVLDGKKVETEGVSLIVANCGNIGFAGLTMLPEVKIDDGYLNVFVFKSTDMGYMASLAQERMITGEKNVLEHWKAKKISIHISGHKQSVICDDDHVKSQKLDITVIPKAVTFLVP